MFIQKTKENINYADNLLIKGENLAVINYLNDEFKQQIDVIYIDPPYNRGSNLCYKNKFARDEWLAFIKERIKAAMPLLKKDGSLIVAIDEKQQAQLFILLQELFPKHEVHCIVVIHNPRGRLGKNFSYMHEYILFVIPKNKKVIANRRINQDQIKWRNLRKWGSASTRQSGKNCFYGIVLKDKEIVGFTDVLDENHHPPHNVNVDDKIIVYPVHKDGQEAKWRYARKSVEKVAHLLRVRKIKTGYDIDIGKDFAIHKTVWSGARYDANEYGKKLLRKLVPSCEFDFPKSLWNVYDCLACVVGDNKQAKILDFFAGSGTTAHATIELNKKDGGNRKFILCERMDYIKTVTLPRIAKVIPDSFIYCEL